MQTQLVLIQMEAFYVIAKMDFVEMERIAQVQQFANADCFLNLVIFIF